MCVHLCACVCCVWCAWAAAGSFGDMYNGVFRGEQVAVKEIHLPEREVRRAELREQFAREVKMMKRLSHPNILTYVVVTFAWRGVGWRGAAWLPSLCCHHACVPLAHL